MSSTQRYENAVELLTSHNQGHLLAFYDQLDDRQKQHLLDQIDRLDFSQISAWITNHVKNTSHVAIPTHFDPAPSYTSVPTTPQQEQKYAKARKLGAELISAGKVAAFVVAGGQGTRLGFDGPKGNFPISPIKNKTLFQFFAETILAAGKKYGANLPWYIMTNPLNYSATVEIFQSNDYYGLDKSDVFIFQQGTLPNFRPRWQNPASRIKQLSLPAPTATAAASKALYNSGALTDMKTRAIELVSYWQVDNPLVNIFDPLFHRTARTR